MKQVAMCRLLILVVAPSAWAQISDIDERQQREIDRNESRLHQLQQDFYDHRSSPGHRGNSDRISDLEQQSKSQADDISKMKGIGIGFSMVLLALQILHLLGIPERMRERARIRKNGTAAS